jgi:hypothetical protein
MLCPAAHLAEKFRTPVEAVHASQRERVALKAPLSKGFVAVSLVVVLSVPVLKNPELLQLANAAPITAAASTGAP